jgi:hypothetical protein
VRFRKERRIDFSPTSKACLRFCALAALCLGLLFAPGAAQATTAGRPVAWGCGSGNDGGQCSVPAGLAGVTAISAGGYHSLALKSDGTVVAWGCSAANNFGQCNVPSGLRGVKTIAAGYAHSLALKGDGSVVAWGCGGGLDFGQCSVPIGLSGVGAISAGATHSLALKSDGTVVAWGCRSIDYGQCSVPSGLAGVAAISAGSAHSLALKRDGSVSAWGCADGSDDGQCTVPNGLAHVAAVSAAISRSVGGSFGSHSLALVAPATSLHCKVPNVVGKRLAAAKRTIARRHCRSGKVRYAYSSKRAKGTVISQRPRPGRVLPVRSKINLVASRGSRH